ncbi:MFS transporter [Haloglycomyces albus]|uniref:MFS transporter n=1 Tax=Haloglycomyces albus TaxID=526067 RepID=UPI00046D7DF7|nr:MFS transporter [Haloglycomyces albus]
MTHPDVLPRIQNRWIHVIGAGLLLFMIQLDALTVSASIPTITTQLDTTPAVAQWALLGYTLPAIAFAYPAGRWLSTIGQRTALLYSITGFAGIGILAALSPTIELLITARVGQGCFAALTFVLMPLWASDAVQPEKRGRAMGIVFTIGPLGGLLGPFIGGQLTDLFGWQPIFLLNLPVAVVTLAIAATLPADGRLHTPNGETIKDALLMTAAAGVVMVSLTLASETHLAYLAGLLVAVPILITWLRLPAGEQIKRLLAITTVRGSLTALWAQTAVQLGISLLIPFFAQRELGASAGETGILLTVLALGMIVGSPASGWLSDYWGARQTAATGMIGIALGALSLVGLNADWSLLDVTWRMGILGLGIGLFAGAQTALTISAVPANLASAVSGAISLARQCAIGTAPALATIAWSLGDYGITGMRMAIIGAAIIAVIGFVAVVKGRTEQAAHT